MACRDFEPLLSDELVQLYERARYLDLRVVSQNECYAAMDENDVIIGEELLWSSEYAQRRHRGEV